MKAILGKSIQNLEKWVENHAYKGYDPFDGLSSYLKPLTFDNLLLDRLLMQVIRQSPLNLRPILGVKPLDSTIGRGYMAWGYLIMWKLTNSDPYRQKAMSCLKWLIDNKAPNYEDYGWGKHFNYASRGGRYPRLEPIIVWTGLIGQTFLEAYEILGDKKYLEIAASISRWILNVPREKTESGTCLSYYAFAQSSIHNSNMIGAAMLARTSKLNGDKAAQTMAKEAMEYSCSRQLPNGAWYYGEAPNMHWIDNFHTGYNLDSLKCYIDNTNDKSYEENLRRGFEYFKRNFFEENGRPKYYHNRAYPIDSQCASQAIDTLVCFSDDDEEALSLAIKVAKWTIDNMQDKTGYFYYRRYPFFKAKAPMIHWAQATTYKALALLLSKIDAYEKRT